MTTDTNLKPPVNTAAAASTPQSAQPTATAPIKPASSVPPVAPVKPDETKVDTVKSDETKVDTATGIAKSGYKSEDYNGAPIVMLKLAKAGIMQYDSQYRLKLDSTEPTPMPLTPFFASRLNSTVLLCN